MKRAITWVVYIVILMLLFVACTKQQEETNSSLEEGKTDFISTGYLSELLFDRYEALSVEEYREKIKGIVDGNEDKYKDFFTEIDNNENPSKLYEPGTEQYYLFNVVIPTISDRWLNGNFGTMSTYEKHQIEYSIEYSILDPRKVTVKERDEAISRVYVSFEDLAKDFSQKNYSLEHMKTDFDEKAKSLTNELSNENFTVLISGVCRFEEGQNADTIQHDEHKDITSFEVSKEEYEQLISLNTNNISEKTVADFLQIYVDKIQSEEFQNIQNKVFRNIAENKIPTYVTDEDLDFLTITLEATSKEFVALYQEKSEKAAIEYRIDNVKNNKGCVVFVNYEVLYTIADNNKLKIKDRDDRIRAIKADIEKYIQDKTKEELNIGFENIQAFLKELAEKYSNEDIKFEVLINSYNVE